MPAHPLLPASPFFLPLRINEALGICCSTGQQKVLERGSVRGEHGPENLQASRAGVQMEAQILKILVFKNDTFGLIIVE